MLTVRWGKRALSQLDGIADYIAQFNADAAEAVRTRIERVVDQIPEHPYMYRAGRVAGTREVIAHPNYLVVYRVAATSIQVLRVLHVRQRYP